VTVAQQREAVQCLARHGNSVRRACVLVQLLRATLQYRARPRPEDAVLLADITALAQEHPRYGYRRIWALLKRKRTINRKRVSRLWKRARLQVKRTRATPNPSQTTGAAGGRLSKSRLGV
jgi:putative transposase